MATTPEPAGALVNTPEALKEVLIACKGSDIIGLDLEGMNDESPNKRCSLLTIGIPSGRVWAIDLHVLTEEAWDMDTEAGTLRGLIEGPKRKLMWDVRFDHYTLVHGHGVYINNPVDLQVATAFRLKREKYVRGLNPKCFTKLRMACPFGFDRISEAARRVWQPRAGGRIEAWRERPMHPSLLPYALQDVSIMFDVHRVLAREVAAREVAGETEARLRLGGSADYVATDRRHRNNPFYVEYTFYDEYTF